MKKAEIIKNGNVNLKTVKSGKKVNKEIDWVKTERAFTEHCNRYYDKNGYYPKIWYCFEWFKKRLSK